MGEAWEWVLYGEQLSMSTLHYHTCSISIHAVTSMGKKIKSCLLFSPTELLTLSQFLQWAC